MTIGEKKMRFRKFNSGSIIFSAIIAIAVISGINTAEIGRAHV